MVFQGLLGVVFAAPDPEARGTDLSSPHLVIERILDLFSHCQIPERTAIMEMRRWCTSAQTLAGKPPPPHNLSKLEVCITLYDFLQLIVGYLSTLNSFKLAWTSRMSWLVTRGNESFQMICQQQVCTSRLSSVGFRPIQREINTRNVA
jgi:hypothetical protein